MTILFLSYWGFHEGLTQATVFPHLQILSEYLHIEKVIFCTIERTGEVDFDCTIPKVEHHPLVSKPNKNIFLNKVSDFIDFPKYLRQLCDQKNVTKIIARGAPAGALAYLVWKKNKVPYYVESYEPHADYMRESDIWSFYDPRYLLQKYWEKKQNKTASGLMPVSENYRNYLIDNGIESKKIDVIPCVVDIEKFQFNLEQRNKIRQELNISDTTTVGVYVGKFGGIYLDALAFDIFEAFAKQYQDFHLVILTPDDKALLEAVLLDSSIKYFTIKSVSHTEVPSYLSASDIAFATIKPASSRKYCSAIKVGEYWANGLPIAITPGVGDDSRIIQEQNVGWVVHPFDIPKVFEPIAKTRAEIAALAQKYRSLEISKRIYQKWYATN